MQKETKDLLFEIGVEELPAGYILPALDSWQSFIQSRLVELKLSGLGKQEIISYSTPRRLALLVKNILVSQEDEEIEKVGPSISVAFDDKGVLTKAGSGFLRGADVTITELDLKTIGEKPADTGIPYIKKTAKGQYIAVNQTIKGKNATELLNDLCRESLSKMIFPKMMKWKEKDFRFARPVRWILALFGDEVLSFTKAGVSSDNITYGNDFKRETEPVIINRIDEYLSSLEKNFVIADREKRRLRIFRQVETKAKEVGGVVTDNELLEEVTDIVEYPTAVLAQFGEEYLDLPVNVIHSTLAKNQRYFPVYKDKGTGELLNKFIYIANNLPQYAENTREGNERVVKARLADAQFYFDEDRAKSIDYFNEQLDGIVFHVKLGSIREKVERVVKISDYLCLLLAVGEDVRQKVLRAAKICKFDLATAMIGEKEFTGLQGYIGKEYARYWEEDKDVARAIEEHYLPVGFDGLTKYLSDMLTEIYNKEQIDIPSDLIGQIVSLADKTDTLCAFLGVGIKPSGSKDQYGLRRTGNSIVRLIVEANLLLDLSELVDYTYSVLIETGKLSDKSDIESLYELLRQRIDQYLKKTGIAYDVVEAVLAVEFNNLVKVVNKAKALQSVREREDFEHLMLSFKRVSNIISSEKDFTEVCEGAFVEEAEKILFDSINDIQGIIKVTQGLAGEENYQNMLECFITLNRPIDLFFDKVLVNTEEEMLRKNRYALLNSLRNLFLNIGDLSRIVIENLGVRC